MTTVTDKNEPEASAAGEAAAAAGVDMELVGRLMEQARSQGLELTGEGGLLQQLTKVFLESALEGELTAHLGHEKGERAEGDRENYRNGHGEKTVNTDSGPVRITVPRDRTGSFEPQIVKKRQRRLGGIDEIVLSLSAKGLTYGEISAHLREIYGIEASKTTISTISPSGTEDRNSYCSVWDTDRGCWQFPSGATEDRNLHKHGKPAAPAILAVALRGDRGSQHRQRRV